MSKNGPYPNDLKEKEVYSCKVEKYDNSIKDRQVLSTNDKKQGFTFIMRDAKRQFIPSYKHTIKVKDYRFENQPYNIYDIRFDKPEAGYITVVVAENE
ncbi:MULTISPECIES: hypothetical protein [Staphylococcus]|uniref:Phage head-tail adapter protein n=1 Tax=Staphylococcus equorum TaxID=246432 RepID=A0AAW7AJF5_9STAP|nr:hypothetical protein [Staphylococcus equorum]MDK9867039.1 hypothetical protein [Staphylococcus equorum]MDK9869999.1 hypothetical protein [Staphylococcus equorum]